MELGPINCCFCDKNLSSVDGEGGSQSIIKYKCPGCAKVYCSANCCSGHKEKFSCSAVRNRTPYVSLSKFDQKQFLDDYFFLEEINGKIDSAQRVLNRLRIKKQQPNRRRYKKKANRAIANVDDNKTQQ